MKRFIGILAASLLPLAGNAQLYIDTLRNVEAEIFIPKQRYARAQQGMEIYDDLIFSIEDGGHVNVYDFRTADTKPVAMFELASSRKDNHANNASFGVEIKKGASFPLLYISVGKPGAEIDLTCFVESITRKGKKFSSELVQKIVLDINGWAEAGYAQIFGAPSWMVDQKRGELWVFSARKRTTPKITLNDWENQYVATRFRVPALSEGEVVNLNVDDILEQVVLPYDTGFTQAGDVYDGKLFYGFGVGKQDPARPSRVRIYDLDRRVIAARYNVQEELPLEIEDLKYYKGSIYVNNNTNPKKTSTPPSIYRLAMPSPLPEPADAVEEIRQDPEKAAGVYYVTDIAAKYVTPAPEGYKPFYITGYIRHGARHVDDPVTYLRVYECLEDAAATDNFTEFGKAIYDRFAGMKQNLLWHEGDLTQIGYRQARDIGRRMVENYPEVFEGEPYLKAHGTNVLRVAASMQSLAQGITSKCPDAEWAEISNSRSFLPELNPYGTVCPGRAPIDERFYHHDTPWYRKYAANREAKIDADEFLSRMFKDIEAVKSKFEPYDLVCRFWYLASVQQGLDRQVPLWDMFTEEEILKWAEVENYKYYTQRAKDECNFGRGWGLGSRTLRYLIQEASYDMARGRNGVNLNFGHDGTLMGVLVNLDADNWGAVAKSSEEALNVWKYWEIPMGSNLQLVLYRNSAGDVLVKAMLNEKNLKLPLESVSEGFYRWNDFYTCYMRHCDEVEKSLKETENVVF